VLPFFRVHVSFSWTTQTLRCIVLVMKLSLTTKSLRNMIARQTAASTAGAVRAAKWAAAYEAAEVRREHNRNTGNILVNGVAR
jgi:hypothetical protein